MIIGGIWLGLGANIAGHWGSPSATIARAVDELSHSGLTIIAQSALYTTPPMGSVRQPHYLNAVVEATGSIAPAALLRLVKTLERRAGRRTMGHWRPRPLDIDILDIAGRQIGGRGASPVAGRLQLPHPGLADRGFVLVPFAQISPTWRHPRSGQRASDLLRRNPRLKRGIARVGR